MAWYSSPALSPASSPSTGRRYCCGAHVLLVIGLGGSENPEIVLSMLIIALGHDDVAAGMGVARQLHVFVRDGLRGAANLHFRSVAVIDPVDWIAASAASAASAAATTAARPSAPAPAARSLVVVLLMTLSHVHIVSSPVVRNFSSNAVRALGPPMLTASLPRSCILKIELPFDPLIASSPISSTLRQQIS